MCTPVRLGLSMGECFVDTIPLGGVGALPVAVPRPVPLPVPPAAASPASGVLWLGVLKARLAEAPPVRRPLLKVLPLPRRGCLLVAIHPLGLLVDERR